jgi:hypothetical protein
LRPLPTIGHFYYSFVYAKYKAAVTLFLKQGCKSPKVVKQLPLRGTAADSLFARPLRAKSLQRMARCAAQ